MRTKASSVASASAARRHSGESLVEVLVAILVSGLAILMLATVIAVAADTIHRSREAMDDYFAASNGIAAASSVDATGTVQLTALSGESVQLSDDTIEVTYTVSDEIQNTPVVIYEEKDEATS